MSMFVDVITLSLALFMHAPFGAPRSPLVSQTIANVPIDVPVDWLAAHLRDANVVVVAVGFDRDRAAFDSAHITGSRFLPYEAFAHARNGLITELPPLVTLDSVLESIGVSDRSQVVIYGPPVVSHRLFLTLDVSGLRGRVGILNGGLEGWRAAGRAVTADRTPIKQGDVTLRPVVDAIVDRGWVRANLTNPRFQFVDTRMRRRFDAGHLPGALSTPFPMLIAAGPTRRAASLVSRDSLDAVLAAARVAPTKETVAYCSIGESASVLYFVLRSLGRPVRLYDGSMEEWTSDPTAPLEKARTGR
jgi:thiosulfate/3-mercaptopyruvate sulfurtransferase